MKAFHMTQAKKHIKILNEKGHRERAEYIAVPEGYSEKDLREDIDAGAVFLREIPSVLQLERKEKVYYIHTGREEEGLLAMAWMEALLDEEYDCCEEAEEQTPDMDWSEDFDLLFEDEEEETDGREFIDDPGYIIRIAWSDINRYLMEEGETGGMFGGGFAAGYARSVDQHKPFWTECGRNPICIFTDLFGGHVITEEMMELFEDNPRIYIIQVDAQLKETDRKNVYPEEEEQESPFAFLDIDRDDAMKRSMVNTGAEYVKVVMDKDEEKRFYGAILRSRAKEEGCRLYRDFHSEKVVEKLLDLCGENGIRSSFVEKAVVYVVKRKKNGKTLTEDDFSILFSGKEQEIKKKADAWKRLDEELIGLSEVKKRVRSIVNNLRYQKIRRERGLKGLGYHNVFMMLGAPGTAKTTVAQLIGDILREERLLKGNRFLSVNGAELKGKYVGWTTEKVREIFERYDVIFIDEAYSLVSQNGDSDTFSQEAIAQLCIELEAHAMDRLVIFAGYGGEDMDGEGNLMRNFLRANPGITSRINATIFFPSYTAEEMIGIFHAQARSKGLEADHGADEKIREYFEKRIKTRDFGNGREARSLLECGITQMAGRMSGSRKYSKKELNRMTEADILAALEEKNSVFDRMAEKEKRKVGFMNV